MKITHVILAMSKGGAERVTVDLANASAVAGHEVSIVLAFPLDPGILQKDLDRRIKIHFVSERQLGLQNYLAIPAWIMRNRDWLFEQDLIHCHLTFGLVFGSLVQLVRTIRAAARPKVIETYHATGTREGYVKRAFHRALLKRRDAVVLVALDDYWSNFARSSGLRRVELIPNGVSDPRLRPHGNDDLWYRAELGISNEAFVIGSISRLAPEREPERFIEVFARFIKLWDSDSHLLLAGDGPERKNLEKLVVDRGLQGRVIFVGEVQSPIGFLGLLDLYLSLSVRGLTGIAGLEATFARLPIVSIQADPDYKTGPMDWFWSSSDLSEVAAKIADLARAPRQRLALGAFQSQCVCSLYALENMANSYLRLYEETLQQDRKRERIR